MDRIRRLLFDHRRLLAAVLTGLAVLAGLASVRAETPATDTVVVSARDLPSGTLLTHDDVREVDVTPDLVPDHAAGGLDDVVGRRLAGPVRRGEALTDARLLGPGSLLGRPAGTVVATVRIADPVELQSVSVGERVDVVAVVPDDRDGRPRATVVAEGLEVLATDDVEDGSMGEATGSAVVRVAASREVAVELAAAGADARLGVITVAGETED